MMLGINVCKNCTDRYIGCHSECEKYKNVKLKNEALRKAVFERKSVEYGLAEHISKTKKRSKN